MTARVLIVDDVPANVKLLEIRLAADYFDVVTASNGPDALAICERGQCDIVLLDVMMPGMDGFEVARRLKSNPATYHLPIIMITALDQPADRVRGIEAGADDFVTKPVDDVALLTRVRSLVRLKMVTDELRMRAAATREFGLPDPIIEVIDEQGTGGRILLVEDRPRMLEHLSKVLGAEHQVEAEQDPNEALFRVAEGGHDLAIISLDLTNFDALRLCSQIRSLERTRYLPILLLAQPEDRDRLLRGLDIGVNDYLIRPIDRNELLARARTQIRRRRYTDRLRDNVQHSIEMAITDGLTGLNNRRYMESHLAIMLDRAAARGRPVSVMLIDIDFFKTINDTWGHDAGDDVLREFALRLRSNIRGIDLTCRYGGEEFVVAMPDTDLNIAGIVAERLRQRIEAESFQIKGGAHSINVTISIGIATRRGTGDDVASLLRRADAAVYRAKSEGRNRVVSAAA
ncbi:PleD family two-component system response regulator [Bosea sp. 117]|uniref:PleD family two-component system response regulator n=1 Tax=Bosea sp. 117 TaxID=1125973 RepID=UPI0004942B39|nr:PleD family two-component system response regulator [Bosea sp. 117]